MIRSTAISLSLCLATVTAQAALVGRAALTSGGSDYQAYYDNALNITWLQNANLVVTDSFGVNYNPTSYFYGGRMSWYSATAWIAGMNSSSGGLGYLGQSNWRLPTVTDSGAQGCVGYAFSGTDCGFNVDLDTGEMAHLHYSTLGNIAEVDATGYATACTFLSCLVNRGPFTFGDTGHIAYWTSTSSAVDLINPNPYSIWIFGFQTGGQIVDDKVSLNFALPVLDGDPLGAAVPIPPAVWLFGSALALMGGLRRSRRQGPHGQLSE